MMYFINKEALMKKLKMIIFALFIISIITILPKVITAANDDIVIDENNSTYKFTNYKNEIWTKSSSDIVSSNFHVTSNYEYDSSKKCSYSTPDSDNYQQLLSSCYRITNQTTYSGTSTKYPTDIKRYSNGKLVSRYVYLRNSNLTIKEARLYTYFSSGIIKTYKKYYGGKNLNADIVRYKNVYAVTRNSKNQVLSVSYYLNSQIWNGSKATIPYKGYKYYYYANGKIKKQYSWVKNVKYNAITSSITINYSANGKRSSLYKSIYTSTGKLSQYYSYYYNKMGQLKSNKYGKATCYKATYVNGKKKTAVKYQYTVAGKAKRI